MIRVLPPILRNRTKKKCIFNNTLQNHEKEMLQNVQLLVIIKTILLSFDMIFIKEVTYLPT